MKQRYINETRINLESPWPQSKAALGFMSSRAVLSNGCCVSKVSDEAIAQIASMVDPQDNGHKNRLYQSHDIRIDRNGGRKMVHGHMCQIGQRAIWG